MDALTHIPPPLVLSFVIASLYAALYNLWRNGSPQSREEAEPLLKSWYYWAIRSQVEQVKRVARTVKEHWNGILNWFDSKLSNGFLEGINSLLQAAKARARGYRSTKNLINMAYMIAGKLDFGLPT